MDPNLNLAVYQPDLTNGKILNGVIKLCQNSTKLNKESYNTAQAEILNELRSQVETLELGNKKVSLTDFFINDVYNKDVYNKAVNLIIVEHCTNGHCGFQFFVGKKLDKDSNLNSLPKEIVQYILDLKSYSHILDVKSLILSYESFQNEFEKIKESLIPQEITSIWLEE